MMRRQGSNLGPGAPGAGAAAKPKNTLAEIQRLEKEREERRLKMAQFKKVRADEDRRNQEAGNPGDVDFQRLVQRYRESGPVAQSHHSSGNEKITICVRKRPISAKEIKKSDYDSITCANPVTVVHESKMKVDGISK